MGRGSVEMTYFVRTEETLRDAQLALERKRSVRRWAFAGASPWEFLAFAIPEDEQLDALREYGVDVDAEGFDLEEAIHGDLFAECDEERLAGCMNLEPFGDGGYAEFLPGLCALEAFDAEPRPEDCTQTLDGELLALLACYEGEAVGEDPDEGWILFHPKRIVWTHETGSTVTRWREI